MFNGECFPVYSINAPQLTNWSCQWLLISGTMSEADFPPIKYKGSTILSKLLAAKQWKCCPQLSLKTLDSVKSKRKYFKKIPRILNRKNSTGVVFSILSAKPKLFHISLLCSESFAYLIKLSKHRPPTGWSVIAWDIETFGNCSLWKTMTLVYRNLKLTAKWDIG